MLTAARSKRAAFWAMSVLLSAGLALLCLVVLEKGLRFVSEHRGNTLNSLAARMIPLREATPGSSDFYRPEGPYPALMAEARMPAAGVTESFDENGFLQPSGAAGKPDLKIVFLGGSTTQNIHVPPTDKFAYLTGRILSAEAGCQVGTYNAGLSGNDSIDNINVLVNKALPLRPDFAVFMENINDLQKLIATGGYWNNPDIRPYLAPQYTLAAGGHALAAKTAPYAFHLLGHLHDVAPADEWQSVRGKRRTIDAAAILASQRAALGSLIEVAKSWNVRPIVIVPPSRFKAEGESQALKGDMDSYQNDYGLSQAEFFRLYAQANDNIRLTAKEHGALLIDLDRNIPSKPEFIYDRVHMSIQGSRLAARVIAETLLPLIQASPKCAGKSR
jgi:hypothetical protein